MARVATARGAAGANPPAPEPPGDGDALELYGEPFEHRGLSLFQETGDMAALADTSFNDWTWVVYRLRSAEEMQSEHTRHQRILITKLSGPVDIPHLQQVCGGGVFEIRGFFENILRSRLTIELAGPRKDYSTPAPAPAAAPVVTAGPSPMPLPNGARRVLRLLRRQNQVLEQLVTKINTPAPAAPAASANSLELVDTVLNLADRLAGRQNPSPESGVLNTVVGAFEKGMEVARTIEGAPEASQTEKIVQALAPMAERILTAMVTRRPPPPRRVEPGSRSPGQPATPPPPPIPEADVVNEAPAELDDDTIRFRGAVDTIARALAARRDARDLAASLEDLLSAEQLAMIRNTPDAAVIEQVVTSSAAKYPVLGTDGGRVYLGAVLEALKAEPEEDEAEDDGIGP